MPGFAPADTLRTTAMTFATYSGIEACIRPMSSTLVSAPPSSTTLPMSPASWRMCIPLLKPGGCAFFMEPNLEFHRALTRTMGDIVAELLRDQSVSEPDISLMLNWTGEVHCNIVNTGDIEVLAEREDKHLFVGDDVRRLGESRGLYPGGGAALRS